MTLLSKNGETSHSVRGFGKVDLSLVGALPRLRRWLVVRLLVGR